jgi:hypothetical protein
MAGAKLFPAVEVQPYPHEYKLLPLGCVMRMAAAFRLKTGAPEVPVMPGAAACADSASIDPSANVAPNRPCPSSD